MLQGLAGNEAFRKALQKYLRKFAYSNAESGDLWEILQEVSNDHFQIRFLEHEIIG